MDENNKVRILFLTSDPSDAGRLRLGQELRDVRERLQLSKQRDNFFLESRESIRPGDITQAIFDINPHIVHFSGHGTQYGEICLEDISGKVQPVSPNALSTLFSLVSNKVKCVVLNACYSETQAQAIAKCIPFVIGMNKAIGDKAAIAFSVGFYKAVVAGYLVEDAYKFGCTEIQLHGLQEQSTPVLHTSKTQQIDTYSLALPDFYIERHPIESNCYDIISKPCTLIRIEAPWQMGKTLLMMKILDYASQQGCHSVRLSFQEADSGIFNDIDLLLKWFCVRTTYALGLENKLADYWDLEYSTSKINCTRYFQEYLLRNIDAPVVIGMDELDLLFQEPRIGTEFLGFIRAWYEMMKMHKVWRNLRIVLAYVSLDKYVLSPHESPFNVGYSVQLPSFGVSQVERLAHLYNLDISEEQVRILMSVVDGKPYLIQEAFKAIFRQEFTLNDLLDISPCILEKFRDHLNYYLSILESNPDLKSMMKQIVDVDNLVALEASQFRRLIDLGLIKRQGNNIVPACKLYRNYFYEHL